MSRGLFDIIEIMNKLAFRKTENYSPKNIKEKRLFQAFTTLINERDAINFLRDLLTPVEIEEFANRLEIARLLLEQKSYLEIARLTNVSTTTVTRVAHWLFKGCGGYWKILQKK